MKTSSGKQDDENSENRNLTQGYCGKLTRERVEKMEFPEAYKSTFLFVTIP